jgi:hypothetical protein
LINGKATVTFERDFTNSISDKYPVNITVTPMGNSNGVYVADISSGYFTVNENNNGASNVSFNWVAIGVKQGCESPQIPQEVLAAGYNTNMHGVMVPDNSSHKNTGNPIWWDGNNIRFDALPNDFENPCAKATPLKHESAIKPRSNNISTPKSNNIIAPTKHKGLFSH